ncbi:MAG: hypothetical protein UU24_C0002G0032, partial [Candidatus Nomurabacteria bacterium GW2011_GWA2_40_9]
YTATAGSTGTADNAPTEKVTILNDGNVGIGTTGPSRTLHVVSTGDAGAFDGVSAGTTITNAVGLSINNTSATTGNLAGINFGDNTASGSGASATIAAVLTNRTSHYADIAFGTRAADGYLERMRILSTGNVGIGTTSPNSKLHIYQADTGTGNSILRLQGVGDQGEETGFTFYAPYGTDSFNRAGRIYTAFNDASFTGARLTLQSMTTGDTLVDTVTLKNGNVGIGTTSPGAKLDIGLAGTTLGTLRLEGNTSGYVQLQPAAAAGSWTLTLPDVDGDAGQQLQTDGAGITSWAAAGSLRSMKDISGEVTDANVALDQILGTKIYRFHYKPKMGTGDSTTEYVGVMADEAQWAMHFNGTIVNPVNTLGYMVLGIQATNKKIDGLDLKLEGIEERLVALEGGMEGESATGVGNFGTVAAGFFSDVVKKVENGVVFMKGLVVDTLKIGSRDKRTGVTLYDEVTGEPYCLSVANGATKTIAGECVVIIPPENTLEPITKSEPVETPTSEIEIIPLLVEEGAGGGDPTEPEIEIIEVTGEEIPTTNISVEEIVELPTSVTAPVIEEVVLPVENLSEEVIP